MGEAKRGRRPGSVHHQVRIVRYQLTTHSPRSGTASGQAFRGCTTESGSDWIRWGGRPRVQSRQESPPNQRGRTSSGLRPRPRKGRAYSGLDEESWTARTQGFLARRDRLQTHVPAGRFWIWFTRRRPGGGTCRCALLQWKPENTQLPKFLPRSRSMNVGSSWRQRRNTRNTES